MRTAAAALFVVLGGDLGLTSPSCAFVPASTAPGRVPFGSATSAQNTATSRIPFPSISKTALFVAKEFRANSTSGSHQTTVGSTGTGTSFYPKVDGPDPGASFASTDPDGYPAPLPSTTDPFVLLGIDASPEANPTGYVDAREVKKAYRRMALLHHPDAVIKLYADGKNGVGGVVGKEQRQQANDNFARIHAAYEALVQRQVQYQVRTEASGTTIGIGINIFTAAMGGGGEGGRKVNTEWGGASSSTSVNFDRKDVKKDYYNTKTTNGGSSNAEAEKHWGTVKDRALSKQLDDLKARLEEAERIKVEQHSDILDLNDKIASLEAEVASKSRVREDADALLGRASQRIGKAFGTIFSVLGDVQTANGKDQKIEIQTIPTAEDIDKVVGRLVDDALPLLERRAVQTSTELDRTRDELQEVRSEVSSLQQTLQQLNNDKRIVETQARTAKEHSKKVRGEFFAAVEEQLGAVRTELETKQTEVDALYTKELQVRSQLDILRKEIKERKVEMNKVTWDAEKKMQEAVEERTRAKKAMEQADVLSEELTRKESDLIRRTEQLDESRGRLEADKQALKHDLMALQSQKRDLKSRETDLTNNIEQLKADRRELETTQLSTREASEDLDKQRKEVRAVQDRLLIMQTKQEELEAALADKEQELIESEGAYLNRVAELEKREEKTDAVDTKLKELELDLNQRNDSLKLQLEDIEEQRRLVEKRVEEVAAKEDTATKDRAEVDRLQAAIKSREAELDLRSTELRDQANKLEEERKELQKDSDALAQERASVEREWSELEKKEKALAEQRKLLEKKEAEHKDSIKLAQNENKEEAKRLASLEQKLKEEEKNLNTSRNELNSFEQKLISKENDRAKREEKLAKEKMILEDSIKTHRESVNSAQAKLDEWKLRRQEEERQYAKVRKEREEEERRTQKLAADAKKARESMLKSRVAEARKELGTLQSEIDEKVNNSPQQGNKKHQVNVGRVGAWASAGSKGEKGFGQTLEPFD